MTGPPRRAASSKPQLLKMGVSVAAVTRRRRRRKQRAQSEDSGDDSETSSELEASPGPSGGSGAAEGFRSPPRPAERPLAGHGLADEEMLDAADVDGAESDDASLLTDMNQIPGAPFRGLSITVPPGEIEDLVKEADEMLLARGGSGCLSISIYQARTCPPGSLLGTELYAYGLNLTKRRAAILLELSSRHKV